MNILFIFGHTFFIGVFAICDNSFYNATLEKRLSKCCGITTDIKIVEYTDNFNGSLLCKEKATIDHFSGTGLSYSPEDGTHQVQNGSSASSSDRHNNVMSIPDCTTTGGWKVITIDPFKRGQNLTFETWKFGAPHTRQKRSKVMAEKILKMNFKTVIKAEPNEKFYDVKEAKLSGKDELLVIIRLGSNMIGLQYDSNSATWAEKWREQVFNLNNDNPSTESYPWFIADILGNGDDMVIIRNEKGLLFYKISNDFTSIKLSTFDGLFHNVYSWWSVKNSLVISYFYPDEIILGILTNNQKKVSFYAVNSGVIKKNGKYPLWELDNDEKPSLGSKETWYLTNKLEKNSIQDNIIAIGSSNMEIFKFNKDYKLNVLLAFKPKVNLQSMRLLLFGNITNTSMKDILLFDSYGLHLYQFQELNQNYSLINVETTFSQRMGWRESFYSSVQLLDFNKDGADELLFSGVRGITLIKFDLIENKWFPLQIVKEKAEIYPIGIKGILTKKYKEALIFVQTKQTALQWGTLDEHEKMPEIHEMEKETTRSFLTNDTITYDAFLKSVNKMQKLTKPTLRWVEKWADSLLADFVDKMTGQLTFSLPLAAFTVTPKFNASIYLTYNSMIESSSLIGTGWSINLGRNYITVDYRESIFPEDHSYYIFSDSGYEALEKNEETLNYIIFNIKNSSNIITYDKNKEQWVVKTETEQMIYGNCSASEGIQWTLSEKYWRSFIRRIDDLQRLPISWFLCERMELKSFKKIGYQYESEMKKIGSEQYTTAIRIKEINISPVTAVKLSYEIKDYDEYEESDPYDKQNKVYRFPTSLIDDKFLKSLQIETHNYHQHIQFDYNIIGKHRILKLMKQIAGNHSEIILDFNYEAVTNYPVINQILTILGRNLTFSYVKSKNVEPFHDGKAVKYPAYPSYQIAGGPDYKVLAYPHVFKRDVLVVWVLNQACTKKIANVDITAKSQNINSFQLNLFETHISIILAGPNSQEVCFIEKLKGKWVKNSQTLFLNEKAIAFVTEDMLVISDQQKANIYERVEINKQWVATNLTLDNFTILKISNNWIFGINRDTLTVVYRCDKTKKMQIKFLDIKRTDSCSVVKKFDMSANLLEDLCSAFDDRFFQMNKNIIVMSSLRVLNGCIEGISEIYVLDENYDVWSKYEKVIASENFEDKRHTIKSEEIDLVIGYKEIEGLLKIKVVDLQGKKVDELKTLSSSVRNEIMKESMEDINNNKELNTNFKSISLISWNRFFPALSPLGLIIPGANANASQKIMVKAGKHWEEEEFVEEQSVRLGKHLILYTSDNINFNICNIENKRKPLISFKIIGTGRVVNRYPVYLGYTSPENSTKIIKFEWGKELGKILEFQSEHLLDLSDYESIITLAKSSTLSHTAVDDIIIRTVSSLQSDSNRPEIIQQSISDETINRITRYNRTTITDLNIFTQIAMELPGSSKKSSGWIEYSYSVSDDKQLKESNTKYYDNKGNVVKYEYNKKAKSDNSKGYDGRSPTIMWDQYSEWIISDFYPYNVAENEATYHGFESYEEKHVWKYNEENIVTDGYSFTGNNYLHLLEENNDVLAAVVSLHQDIYIISCWVRTVQILRISSVASFFTATISTAHDVIIKMTGEVKLQSGPWAYVEIMLDYQQLKEISLFYFKSKRDYYANYTEAANPIFTVKIEITATDKVFVDVDNIRYSSMNLEFSANIYNLENGLLTSTINNNGLVTRYAYDLNLNRIATLNENYQLEEFLSGSKSGKLLYEDANKEQFNAEISVKPESGYLEVFDPCTFRNRWQIGDLDAWAFAPRQLQHQSSDWNSISSIPELTDPSSSMIRASYFMSHSSILRFDWADKVSVNLSEMNGLVYLQLGNHSVSSELPQSAEILIFRETFRLIIWIDGVITFDGTLLSADKHPGTKFSIRAKGLVQIQDLMIMNKPEIKVQYFNAFGEKTQVILLESENCVAVSQSLYDELGREAITTKLTRIERECNQSIFRYYTSFITNIGQGNASVWSTGVMNGLVASLNPDDSGYPYKQIDYHPNPLKEKRAEGLPGAQFSIHGPFAKYFLSTCDIPIIKNQFPTKQGYRKNTEKTPNGSQHVSVFDKNNNNVAKYVRVAGYDHILTTFEFDNQQRLIKVLPPNYHDKVNTSSKINAWVSNDSTLTNDEFNYQRILGTFLKYNNDGQVIQKMSPDTGAQEFIYDSQGQLKYSYTQSSGRMSEIIYYEYDSTGDLRETGFLTDRVKKDILQSSADKSNIYFEKQTHQRILYFDSHPDPLSRSKLKVVLTSSEYNTVLERLRFDDDDKVIEKNTIPMGERPAPFTDIIKNYRKERIQSIHYPTIINGKPLKLQYHYNKRGFIESLGLPGQPNFFAQFSYNGEGRLIAESDNLNPKRLERKLKYNSPGFLIEINDPFLEEAIYYTEGGYGQKGFGDGIIMKTKFVAKWTEDADQQSFQFPREMDDFAYYKVCHQYLRERGFISRSGELIKQCDPYAEIDLPLVCSGNSANQLRKLMAKLQRSGHYGHCYSYGNHQELIRAKYFSGSEECSGPLQPNSFAWNIGISIVESYEIWNILTKAGFIIEKQHVPNNTQYYGTQGKSFLRDSELMEILEALNEDNKMFSIYYTSIKKLTINLVMNKKSMSTEEFQDIYLKWHKGLNYRNEGQLKQFATKLYKILISHNMIPQADFGLSLHENFTKCLKKYSEKIPEIIKTLESNFRSNLGSSPFDEELYEMDPNGNILKFNRGFHQYVLEYENNTNKIKKIKFVSSETDRTDEQHWSVEHDIRGNVIKAKHKSIKQINYHPVSQRTELITFNDGSKLRFEYDSRGERILKQFFNDHDDLQYDIFYLREEDGRVLMEQKTTYLPSSEIDELSTTAYIYGPRGLLGFIRDGEYHSVTIDHSGSIRLVIRNDQVVAAYDYMPYGEIMRSYGNDPKADIMYRYTGQEYDPESGLYNFHTRLYDPTIGRFYQTDPQAQYASPYKYAGNSPISFTDPDGQFAFLLAFAIVGALVGGYLGGAAANNTWNPAKWQFNAAIVFGVLGGALAGALLPYGFAGSVATITAVGQAAGLSATAALAAGVVGTTGLGLGGAYLTAAVANNGTWNPGKWKWDDPNTYSSLFQGFGTGSGLVAGIGVTHRYASELGKISKLRKFAFLGVSYGAGGAGLYAGGVVANNGEFNFVKWNWKSPSTFLGLANGFDSLMGWPQNVLQLGKGSLKVLKNAKSLRNVAGKIKPSLFKKLAPALKDRNNPMYKVAFAGVAAYYMGSAANGNFTHWRNEWSTYEAVINGIFFGKDFTNTKKLSENENLRKAGLEQVPKNAKASIKKAWNAISGSIRHTVYSSIKRGLMSVNSIKNVLHRLKEPTDFLKNKYTATPIDSKLVESRRVKFGDASIHKAIEIGDDLRKSDGSDRVIHTDKEVNFLPCGRKLRRRRGTAGGASCRIPVVINDKKDVMGDIIQGKDVHKSVKRILGEIPKDHSTNDPNFYHNFFLGAIASLPKNLKESVQAVYISRTEAGREFGKSPRLNPSLEDANVVDASQQIIIVSKPENGKSQVSILTSKFISGYDSTNKGLNRNVEMEVKKNWNENKVVYVEDVKRVIKETIPNTQVEVYVHSLVIGDDKSTLLHSEKRLSLTDIENSKNIIDSHDKIIILPKEVGKFQKMNLDATDYEGHINSIINSHSSVDQVQGVKNLCTTFLKDYETSKKFMDFQREEKIITNVSRKSPKEADFHGFLTGALSLNFKKQFDIDILVEPVAGKGYGDVAILVKNNHGNTDWNTIPILLELKSSKKRTEVDSAVQQIHDKGYLYNLPLKTLADYAIIAGINSDTMQVRVEKTYIPKYEGVAEALMNKPTKAAVEKALNDQHMMYSDLANKKKGGNNEYMSHFILGEILSRPDFHDAYVLNNGNGPMQILYKKNSEPVLLTIKDTKDQSNTPPTVLPAGNKQSIKNYIIEKKLVPVIGTKGKKTKETQVKFEFKEEIGSFSTSEKHDFKKLSTVDTNNIFENTPNPTKKVVDDLSKSVTEFPKLLQDESDLQAILQGVFLGNKRAFENRNKNIRVFQEANLSNLGRFDLIVSVLDVKKELGKFMVKEDLISVMELKSVKNKDIASTVKIAKDELADYMKSQNLRALTDLDQVETLAIAYKDGEVQHEKVDYLIHPIDVGNKKRERSSDADSDAISYILKHTRIDDGRSKRSISSNQYSCNSLSSNQLQHDFHQLQQNIAKLIMHSVNDIPFETNRDYPSESMSLLEMGDNWLEQTNLQGNLLWATIISKKLGGSVPDFQYFKRPDFLRELDMHATNLVYETTENVISKAEICGMGDIMKEVLEKGNSHKIIRNVYKQISNGNYESVPQILLHELVLSNLDELVNKTSEKQVGEFLYVISQD